MKNKNDITPKTRRRKKGEGSWGKKTINGIVYHRYRKEYNGTVKEFYGRTVTEVKNKIAEFESKTNNIAKKDIKKLTLYEYMFNWLNNVKAVTVKKQTLDKNYGAIKKQLKPYPLADVQMGSLTSDAIQAHMNELTKTYAKGTIDLIYNPISQCLEYAAKKGDISENPMKDVIKPREEAVQKKKKEIVFLEPEDMDLLYKEAFRKNEKGFCITGKEGTYFYGLNAMIIAFILYTGLRIGEALALQWKNVDFENKEIYINKSAASVLIKPYGEESPDPTTGNNYKVEVDSPKTKNSIRRIPLTDRAYEVLLLVKELNPNLEEDDLVFSNSKGNMMTPANIRRTLNSMLERAGTKVQKCGIHALRHSYATLMVMSGVDIKIASQILGHADVSITYNTYIHVIEKQRVRSAETLNQFIKLNESIEKTS